MPRKNLKNCRYASEQPVQTRNPFEMNCPPRPRSQFAAFGGLLTQRGIVIIGAFSFALVALLSGCRSSDLTRQEATNIIQKSKSWTAPSLEFHVEKGVELGCLTDRKLVVADIKNAFERDLKPTENTAEVLASGKFTPSDDFRTWKLRLDFRSPDAFRITEVTGIADASTDKAGESAKSGAKEVDFNWASGNHKSVEEILACFPTSKALTGTASMRLFDDGWRAEDVHLKTF